MRNANYENKKKVTAAVVLRKLQSEHHWQRNRNQSQFPDSGDILTLLSHHHHQPLTACPDSERELSRTAREGRHTYMQSLNSHCRYTRHIIAKPTTPHTQGRG